MWIPGIKVSEGRFHLTTTSEVQYSSALLQLLGYTPDRFGGFRQVPLKRPNLVMTMYYPRQTLIRYQLSLAPYTFASWDSFEQTLKNLLPIEIDYERTPENKVRFTLTINVV